METKRLLLGLTLLIVFLPFLSFSQISDAKEGSSTFKDSTEVDTTYHSHKFRSFLGKVAGAELPSSLVLAPVANHTVKGKVDIFLNYYTAFNFRGLEWAVFKNSIGNWCSLMVYKRSWRFTDWFAVNWALGAVYGYNGHLYNIRNLWITNNVLFKGNLNPVGGLELDFNITKRLGFRFDIVPLVVFYGLRYNIDL